MKESMLPGLAELECRKGVLSSDVHCPSVVSLQHCNE